MPVPFYKQKTLFGNSEIIFAEGKANKKNTLFEYDKFVDKFKEKKTTDDCYTPPPVYNVILNYLKQKGKLQDGQNILRPFYPGNDYTEVEYTKGSIVVDNPPFSLYSQIVRFYTKHGIPFFIFAPHLTLFSVKEKKANYIIVGADIVYENGATVKTSFASNLFGNVQAFSDLDLYENLQALNINPNPRPSYLYPDELFTVSDFVYLLNKGIEFELMKEECLFVSKLDDQKKHGKSIFGKGLLSTKAKAEAKAKAKAKAAKPVVQFRLSQREQKLISNLAPCKQEI